jgi:hypothetical protein
MEPLAGVLDRNRLFMLTRRRIGSATGRPDVPRESVLSTLKVESMASVLPAEGPLAVFSQNDVPMLEWTSAFVPSGLRNPRRSIRCPIRFPPLGGTN